MSAGKVDVLTVMRLAIDGDVTTQELREAHDAVSELIKAIRPFVALTFAEAATAEDAGRSLHYCECDALNPCWPEGRPYTGKHWGWTPQEGAGGDVCNACRLRAAVVGFGVTP